MEIHDMTDAELVRCVAVEVMGWSECGNDKCSGCNAVVVYTVEHGWNVRNPTKEVDTGWSPLTDWNDAMAVVDAMRAKFFDPYLEHQIGFRPWAKFTNGTISEELHADSWQRAILEAALAAVRKGGE